MKRMGKRMLSAGILTVSILTCACGTKTQEAVVLEEERKEPLKLTFFAPIDSNQVGTSSYQQLILEFSKIHDDIQVSFEGISTKDGYNEFLEERLDAGEGNDVFIVNADMVKPLYEKGYFYDLSDQECYRRLNDLARSQCTIGDIVYCIPTSMTAYGMFVNLKVLDQYGLKPPRNYDEWMECLKTLKENGVTPFSPNRWYGLTVPAMARGLYPIYASEDQDEIISKMNSGEIKIGDYMLDGFKMFEMFVREGYYGEGLTAEKVNAIKANTTDMQAFKNGECAFWFGSISDGMLKDMSEDYIIQGVPALPDATVSLPSAMARLSVNANGKHIEETLKFVEYITAGSVSQIEEEGSLFPTLTDEKSEPRSEIYRELFETSKQPGQIPIEDMRLHFTYWDTIRELCLDIIDGATAEEAAEKYNQIQMEQIREYQK